MVRKSGLESMSRGKPGGLGGGGEYWAIPFGGILLFVIIYLIYAFIHHTWYKDESSSEESVVLSEAKAHATPSMSRLDRIVENAKAIQRPRCPYHYSVVNRVGNPPSLVIQPYSTLSPYCRKVINDYQLKMTELWCEQRRLQKGKP